MRDYASEDKARVDWLTRRMVRKPQEIQASEVQIEVPRLGRFRIFRDPRNKREWLTYLHPETPKERLERMPESLRDKSYMKWDLQGRMEDRSTSRASAIRWIALHWDFVIDRAMKEEQE